MDNIMIHFLLSIAQNVSQSAAQTVSNAAQSMDAAQRFQQSLRIMGLGMLGIFCIIGIIILLTWTLQKLFPVKEKE